MAKRGGLGQRGINLLIPQHSSDNSDKSAENKTPDEKGQKEEKKSSKKDGRALIKKSNESEKAKESAAENSNADEEYESTDSFQNSPGLEKLSSHDPLMVKLNEIEPNRNQPRKNFDEDSLKELADSIGTYGIIEPLIVQKKDDYYEIIAGERRWRAARLAGLKEIPVIVKEYTDREVMEISLIENIQREDLNPIEEAGAYRRLIEEYHLKQDELAERLSKSRSVITNSLRLLKLDNRVQDMLVSELISVGHARALLALTEAEEQYRMAQQAYEQKMSVREIEKAIKRLLDKKNGREDDKKPLSSIDAALDAIFADMEEKMKSSLGTKVKINRKSPEKGKIEIDYYSKDELERIYDILRSEENTHKEL